MYLDHLINGLKVYEFNAPLHQCDAPSVFWKQVSQQLSEKEKVVLLAEETAGRH